MLLSHTSLWVIWMTDQWFHTAEKLKSVKTDKMFNAMMAILLGMDIVATNYEIQHKTIL